jgi:PAS domain S-box-containing protein
MDCRQQKNCLQCAKISQTESSLQAMDRSELEQFAFCTAKTARQLDAVIENSIDTIFVAAADGTILKVNQAYEQLSGVSRAEIIGRNVRDLEGKVIDRSCSVLSLQTGKSATIIQQMLRSNRSSYATSRPVRDPDGNIEMFICVSRDFTEIENLRAELTNEQEKNEKYREELRHIREEYLRGYDIIANDKHTLDALYRARKAASVSASVLITGETGVGKEEFARYIHKSSERRDGPYVRINCGAISYNLVESELFGYEKGAFTGASSAGKKGLLEVATGGTIFLDEIGEFPLDMQVKLLRALQEQEILRVGGNTPVRIDVRVIAATNRNLKQMVMQKKFREDLFYRLSVIQLEIPSLRDRPDDIVPLAVFFLKKLNQEYKLKKQLDQSAFKFLKSYNWPGNVRELKNVIEEAMIMSESNRLTRKDLSPSCMLPDGPIPVDGVLTLEQLLRKTELHYLEQALDKYKSARRAAVRLGLPPSTFSRRLKQLRAASRMRCSGTEQLSQKLGIWLKALCRSCFHQTSKGKTR